METWHVYQLRSDTELLYVGYTRQKLKCRLGYHRRGKPWWPEVTDVRSEEFATEGDARQREKGIWAAESPKYNRNCPFLTADERDALARERVRAWGLANPERKREQARKRSAKYHQKNSADPAYRKIRAAYQRKYSSKRWQQTGPGLF